MTSDWRERFDKKFPRDHDCFVAGVTGIKSFIAAEKQRTREETLKEVLGVVGKRRDHWDKTQTRVLFKEPYVHESAIRFTAKKLEAQDILDDIAAIKGLRKEE